MNDAWATDWLRRFSGSEPSGLMALYDEDARFEDIALSQTVRGRPALREFFAGFMNPAHRRNTFTLIRYSGDAHGGAIEWTWTARHSAPFFNLPAEFLALAPRAAIGLAAAAVVGWLEVARMGAFAALAAGAEGLIAPEAPPEPAPVAELVVEALTVEE